LLKDLTRHLAGRHRDHPAGNIMTAIAATQSANQISPVDERVYHQSNLVGDWKGLWAKNHQPVEFKVVSIQGTTAQVEYTHNGHTERGTGTVAGATVTYGDVTIGTRDGKNAGIEFSVGTAKMTGVLAKVAAPPDQNKLVGTWIGNSPTTGASATVRILSINGRDAQIKATINGVSQQGIGTVYKNTVMFGKSQFSSDNGVNGTVTFQVGHQTLSLAVSRYTPPSTSTSVNKLA
jgi:hypothetical protein